MALVKNINNLKSVNVFSFCEDGKGNIEINFNIEEAGDYKLEISKDDLKSMTLLSKMSEMLNK